MDLPERETSYIVRRGDSATLVEVLWRAGESLIGGNLSRRQWAEIAKYLRHLAAVDVAVGLLRLSKVSQRIEALALLHEVRKNAKAAARGEQTRRNVAKRSTRSKPHRGQSTKGPGGARGQIQDLYIEEQVLSPEQLEQELWDIHYDDHESRDTCDDSWDALWLDLRARMTEASHRPKLLAPSAPGRSLTFNPAKPRSRAQSRGLAQTLGKYVGRLNWQFSTTRPAVTDADVNELVDVACGELFGPTEHLLPLLLLSPFWIRSPSDFQPRCATAKENLSALAHHLFVACDVPAFLGNGWMGGPDFELKWLVWLIGFGQGANFPRFAQAVRAECHWAPCRGEVPQRLVPWLFRAPPELSPDMAVLWAEVHRLGGSEIEFARLRAGPALLIDPTSYLAADDERRFLSATVRWLVRHSETLTQDQCEIVLNWAAHRFSERRCFTSAFSWARRTPASALQAAASYECAYVAGANPALRWPIQGWDWGCQIDDNSWHLLELQSNLELARDSRVMGYCGYSYSWKCQSALLSVFSLSRNGTAQVTVEVDPSTREIVQTRGRMNRSVTDEERAVLQAWPFARWA